MDAIPQLLFFFFFKNLHLSFFYFPLLVICNFRSPTCQALVLEIGETVQILEKSEGESNDRMCDADGFSSAGFYLGMFVVSAAVGAVSPQS